MKIKVDKEHEYVLAVLAPRQRTQYRTVMTQLIRSIDIVESNADRKCDKFVFLHDGVSSGTTGHVIETINKISSSAQSFDPPRTITKLKVPLDIEFYGKRSHWHWLDEVVKAEPDLIIVFDTGSMPVVQYARELGEKHGIRVDVYSVREESKQK